MLHLIIYVATIFFTLGPVSRSKSEQIEAEPFVKCTAHLCEIEGQLIDAQWTAKEMKDFIVGR